MSREENATLLPSDAYKCAPIIARAFSHSVGEAVAQGTLMYRQQIGFAGLKSHWLNKAVKNFEASFSIWELKHEYA